jgi:hypothetical protein
MAVHICRHAGAKIARDRPIFCTRRYRYPLRSACVHSVSLLFSDPQGEAQVPTERPELIGGPWEVASAAGEPVTILLRAALYTL